MERGIVIGGSLVALGTFAFGVVVILGDAAITAGLPVPTALVIRFVFSALLLAGVLLATRIPLRAAPGEGWWLLALGAVVYAIEVSCFFIALGHGTAAAVTLLFYVYPVFVVVAAVAMGRAQASIQLVAALVCALTGAGIVILSSGGLAIDAMGVVFVLCSAVSFATYVIGSELTLKRTHPLTSAMWLCGSAVIGLSVFALVEGNIVAPSGMGVWLLVLGMGIGSSVAFVAFFAGLRMIGSVRTGIISAFEPFSAAILGAIFLAQPLTWMVLVGGVFIVVGAILAVLSRTDAPVEAPGP